MKKLFLLFCLALSFILKAQDSTVNTSDFCGFDKLYFPGGTVDPSSATMFDDMATRIGSTPTPSTATPYTIPVVVHVIHSGVPVGSGSNITYQQIQWQIAALNAAFNQDYPVYNGQAHGPSSNDVQIRFCLAANTTNAGMTPGTILWTNPAQPGVMRYAVPSASTIHQFDMVNPADYAALLATTRPSGTEFPYNMYMNIWIVQDLCDGTSGCAGAYSPVPSVVGIGTPAITMGLDGIVFRANCFGDITPPGLTPTSFPLFWGLDQGKILAHEVGHYLSLFHTFQGGCTTGPCATTGDQCCDTPPSNSFTTLPCSATPVISCPPGSDQVENYMSYSDDECMNTFTQDQTDRMDAWIVASRANLVSTANLTLTGVMNIAMTNCSCCLLTANFNVSPTGIVCPGTSLQFFTPATGSLCANTWNWSFPGGTPSTFVGQIPPPILFSTAGTYIVTLTASDGTSSVTTPMTITVQALTATITGQSELDACNGSTQHLVVTFSGAPGPYNVQICDNTGAVVAIYNTLTQNPSFLSVPVSTTSNTFSLCGVSSATCTGLVGGGPVTFNIVECCDNLFVNGDFEAATGCNILPSTTLLTASGSCTLYFPGSYGVWNPTIGSAGFPIIPGFPGIFGNSMYVDPPFSPPPIPLPIPHSVIWSQTVNLDAADYAIQFNTSGEFGNFGTFGPPLFPGGPLVLQLMVDGAFIGTPITVARVTPSTPWLIYTQNWTNSLGVGPHTVTLCEMDDLTGAKDYLLDNISIRRIGIPTVTVNSPTICLGQTATLTAGGATTYVWSAGATATGVTTAEATPTVTTNYIVTGTIGGCTGTAISTVTVTGVATPTVTISSDPICSGTSAVLTATAPAGATFDWYATSAGGTPLFSGVSFTTPSLSSTTTYYVSSTISGCSSALIPVTVNVVVCCPPFSASKILAATYSSGTTAITGGGGYWIAGSSTTLIAGGATLILDAINLTMSPNYKIVVAPGGKLIVRNGTKIWACSNMMWDGIEVQASSTIGGRVEINSDARIEDAKIAVHIMNSTVQAEFDIHNAVFNKNHKSIVVDPFAGTHLGIVYATKFFSQNTPGSLSPNVATAYTSPFLKAPFATIPGRRAAKGVEVTSVNTIKIGTPGGPAQENLFESLEIGIHSTVNTNIHSINNKFQNIQYGSCGLFCVIPNTGFAIVANIGGSVTVGGAAVTANTFKGCYYGIRINNNVSLDCQLNSFTSVGNNPIFPGKCIYITNVSSVPIPYIIQSNTFKDFITGVELNSFNKCIVNINQNDFKKFDLGTGIYALTNINSILNIISNTFNNTAADYGNTAIRAQNAVISLNGPVTIQSNDIRNCMIGIKNTRISGVVVDQINIIKFVLPTAPTASHYGIWHENCPNGFIRNNNVYKTATTAGSAYNNKLYGYSFNVGCSNSRILDNIATKMNTGFQFAGANSLMVDGFGCNFINFNYTGLELHTTSIGNQGVSGSVAQDNQWQLPSTSAYIGTFGIKKILSPATPVFYTRSLASPWGLTAIQQSPSIPPAVTFSATAVGTPYNCLHGCLTPPFCPHSPIPIIQMAKKLAPYDSLTASDIDITYTNAYVDLKTDSTLYTTGTADDAVVINFKDSLALTNVGKLFEVVEKIVQGDTINAKIINDAVVPKDCKEQSQQIVNKIYTSTWARGEFEFTPPDSAALLTIAYYTVEQCGLAVYDARVMLRIDINDYPIEEDRSMMQMPQTNDVVGVMYPNPANTVAYYEIELAENQTGFVELFDLLGNMVASQKLNTGANKAEIDLTQLASGIYVYKIIINNEFKASNKLVITK